MKSSPLTQALVVCRKELKDWSRDRRSIMTVLVGSLFTPVIIGFMFTTMARQQRQVADVTIPVVGSQHAPAMMSWLRQQAGVTVSDGPANPEEAVRTRSHDIVVVIADDFAKDFNASRPAQVRIVADGSRQDMRARLNRVRGLFQQYNNQIGSWRLIARGISPAGASPLEIEDAQVSSAQQRAGRARGIVRLSSGAPP